MSLNVGIVGLPNVGKSTIFQAITSAPAEAANYPFCTIEPNIGISSSFSFNTLAIPVLSITVAPLIPNSIKFFSIFSRQSILFNTGTTAS